MLEGHAGWAKVRLRFSTNTLESKIQRIWHDWHEMNKRSPNVSLLDAELKSLMFSHRLYRNGRQNPTDDEAQVQVTVRISLSLLSRGRWSNRTGMPHFATTCHVCNLVRRICFNWFRWGCEIRTCRRCVSMLVVFLPGTIHILIEGQKTVLVLRSQTVRWRQENIVNTWVLGNKLQTKTCGQTTQWIQNNWKLIFIRQPWQVYRFEIEEDISISSLFLVREWFGVVNLS